MSMRDEIVKVAFDFYIASGCIEGRDLDNWLHAEQLVLTWHEPLHERDKHVGAIVADEHAIVPSHENITS